MNQPARRSVLPWIILGVLAVIGVGVAVTIIVILPWLTAQHRITEKLTDLVPAPDDPRGPEQQAEPVVAPGPAKQAPEPEPFRGEIAIGKPAASRESELSLADGRTLVAYLRTPWHDDQNIESIAFSPDATLLAAGHKAGVSLWDVATGKRHGVFPVSQNEELRFFGVRSIAFSPDGTLLAGADNRTIYLWSVKDGHELRRIKEPSKDIAALFDTVRFSPDGSTLVSVNAHGEGRVWNVQTGTAISVFEEKLPPDRNREDNDLLVAPDGKSVFYTAHADKKLIKVDVATGKVAKRWDLHPQRTQSLLKLTTDGKALVLAGEPGVVTGLQLWDPSSEKDADLLARWPNNWSVAAISPAGKTLVTREGLGDLHLFDAATGQRCGESCGSSAITLGHLTFAPTGKILAGIAPGTKEIQIWDIDRSANDRTIALDKQALRIAGAANGMLAVDAAGNLLVLDTATGRVKKTVPWEPVVFAVALDAKASQLAAGGERARVVDLAKDSRREAFPVREESVLVFSPDGNLLAGSDHAVIHLDGKAKSKLLTGHRNKIRALVFSPDSQWLASGADDGKIIVWDAARGTRKWEFDAHESSVAHLSFAADGQLLASAGGDADPTLRVWDLTAGKEKTTLGANYAGLEFISGILLAPDGKQIVVCHNSGELDLWDVATGKLSRHLVGNGDAAFRITITPLGPDRFATSDQKKILIWSWAKIASVPPDYRRPRETRVSAPPGFATMLRRFDGIDKVRSLRLAPGGGLIALLGEKECTVRKTASGEALPWKAEHADLNDAVFSLDGKSLLTCGGDKLIKVWDIAKGKLRHTLTGHSASVNAMAFALGGKVLVSGSGLVAGDYELIFWDMPDGKLRYKTKEQTANIISLAATPDGRTVISGSTNGKVYLWNPADGKLIKTLAVDTNCKPLVISADGRRMACDDSNLGAKCRMFVWDLPAGKLLHHLPHRPDDSYRTLGFSPDGSTLLAHTGSTVQIWDTGTGTLRYELQRLHQRKAEIPAFADTGVDAVAVSADGRLLATWSSLDNALKLWNADNLNDARLQQAMAPFLAAGGDGRLQAGMLHLTLSVRGRKSAAALDAIAAMPYPVALKLTASDNLNDRDLGRLKGAKNLRRLDLDGAPWLGEEGLRQISELSSLTSLVLNSPRVNDQGLDHLRHLKALRSLQLGDTDVTPAGIERLQRALPKLDVAQ